MADYADPQYPQAVNPLQNLSNVASISNAAVQNRLAQQELQSRQGLANLYATAPRNADGSIDQNALMQRAPEAGILAPDVMQQGYQQQIQQQTLQQQKVAAAQAKYGLMGASMLPLINNPNVQPADMLSALNTAQSASGGAITDQDKAQVFQSMANNLVQGGTVSDHAKNLVGQYRAMGGDVEGASKVLFGTPDQIDTGKQIQPGVRTITGQFVPKGAPIDKTITPGESAQQVPVIGTDAQGNPVKGAVPLGTLVSPTGGPRSDTVGGAPSGSAAGTATSSNPPGFVQQDFRPGQKEASDVTGASSGETLATDRAAADNSLNTLTNMHMAYNALENASTGHGSAEVQNLKNFALYAFPSLANTDFGKKAANYDLAVSTLNDQARQLAAQFGPKTNDNLDATFAAKPNTEQTKAAALQLQQKIMSLTRANYAKTLYHDTPFQGLNTGNVNLGDTSDDHYGKWSENFNRIVDPVAFGADLMPKQQLATYVKGLSTKPDPSTGLSPRDKFNNGYNLGVVYGLQDHPAAPAQGAQQQVQVPPSPGIQLDAPGQQ